MTGQIYILSARHDAKMKPTGEIFPGSVEDQRLPLSYGGQQNAFRTGQNSEIVPPDCNLVIADRSTLVRTTMTLQHMLAGAGYDPDGKTVQWQPENAQIGLANGFDFAHPGLPAYSPKLPEADQYVRALLEDFWVNQNNQEARDSRRPIGAAMAYHLVEAMLKGLEQGLPVAREGGQVLYAQAIHAPFIDTLDVALLQRIATVDLEGKKVTLKEGWPGHYPMGTYITGRVVDGLRTDSPRVEFTGKDNQAALYSLDDLKRIRDTLSGEAARIVSQEEYDMQTFG